MSSSCSSTTMPSFSSKSSASFSKVGIRLEALPSILGFRAAVIQVDVDMLDRFNLFLGPGCGILLERTHPYINYVELEGFSIGLEMKGHERDLLGAGLFLLKPVDPAGFRKRVQRFARR